MATKDKKEAVRLMTPVGRLINSSLHETDVYTDARGREAVPSYKVELAFEPDDVVEFEAQLASAAVAEWGEGAEDEYWDGDIRSPIQDGDEKAAEREKNDKNGDAYKGMLVLRSHTIFNRNGEDGPGGVYTCGEDAKELDFAERSKIYNGSYGMASVTVQPYKIDGKRGLTLYLNGFQFVKDGERLRGADPSSLFSPMMSKGSSDGKGRKARGRAKKD